MMYSVLRLPPCVRAQVFRQTVQHATPTSYGVQRAFTNTTRTLKQARPQPSNRASSKPPPPITPAAVPQPPKPPVHAPSAPVPRPTYLSAYTAALLHRADPLLLYKAPSHRSFYWTSYILGGLLMLGAYNWSIVVSIPPTGLDIEKRKGSWGDYLLRSVTIGTTAIVMLFATVILIAPARMVRTVSLRSVEQAYVQGVAGGKRPMLRVEMNAPFPFTKPKIVEVRPEEAFLDRNVAAVDIDLTSIPLPKAQEWTETAGTPAAAPRRYAFQRDIRKICYREGIAYLRCGEQGTYLKLDLQYCELLDGGQPLDRLTTPEMRVQKGWLGWVRRVVTI